MFLPADLESDPEVDVPLLLGKLDQGYDVVAGWRQGRRDGKRVASRIANVACRLLFGLEVHDLNWIKAFRREVTDGLALRSQWHRYILVMAHHEGYRIGEVKVPYRAREAGRSKFGLGRLPVSAIDVVTLKFLLTFQRKPIIFFGGLGSALIGAGLLVWAYLGWLFLATQTQRRPLMLAAGIAILSGLLIVLVGFLGELVVNVSERVERLERRLNRDLDRDLERHRGTSGSSASSPAPAPPDPGLPRPGADLGRRRPGRPGRVRRPDLAAGPAPRPPLDDGRQPRGGRRAELRRPPRRHARRRPPAERLHPVGDRRQRARAAQPLSRPARRGGRAGPLRTTSLDVPWTALLAVAWPLVGLVPAYNLALALSTVAAVAAFAWLRRHTRWQLLAAAGALAYACTPHRMFQLTSHFNAVMWWAFPAALLAFEVMLERRRAGGPGVAGGGLAAVTLTVAVSGEFHLILYLTGLLGYLVVWTLVAALAGRKRVPWGRWPR